MLNVNADILLHWILDESLSDWAMSSILRHGIMDKAHDIATLDRFNKQCHLVEVPE